MGRGLLSDDSKSTERMEWLDLLRVFACFSVLLFHVINGYMKDALNYTEMYWPDYMGDIWCIFQRYHVPCFFAISGFLYQKYTAKKFLKWENKSYCKLVLKKLINLGIPYVVFSILYVALSRPLKADMHSSYSIESIYMLYRVPVAQYWYLRALFLMFLIAPIITFLSKGKAYGILLIAGSLSIINVFWDGTINDKSLWPYFACFAIGGILYDAEWFTKLAEKIRPIWWLGMFLVLCIAFVAICCDSMKLNHYVLVWLSSCLMIISLFGLSYSIGVFYGIPRVVSFLAKYTLHIYLLHTWVTGTIRVILRHIGIYGLLTHTIIGTVCGTFITLVVCIVVKKIWFIDIWFEPGKYIGRIKQRQKK